MKKIIWMLAAALSIATTQVEARDRNEQQGDPNRKVSFIDHRLAKQLVEAITEMDSQKLVGTWKQVLFGPTSEKIGRYDSAGIIEDEVNKSLLTLTISATTTSWLPQSVAQQIVAVPSQDIKIYYDMLAQANQPAAVVLEGNFFFIKFQGRFIKCGFVNANTNNLLCIRSKTGYDSEIIGFERIQAGQ